MLSYPALFRAVRRMYRCFYGGRQGTGTLNYRALYI